MSFLKKIFLFVPIGFIKYWDLIWYFHTCMYLFWSYLFPQYPFIPFSLLPFSYLLQFSVTLSFFPFSFGSRLKNNPELQKSWKLSIKSSYICFTQLPLVLAYNLCTIIEWRMSSTTYCIVYITQTLLFFFQCSFFQNLLLHFVVMPTLTCDTVFSWFMTLTLLKNIGQLHHRLLLNLEVAFSIVRWRLCVFDKNAKSVLLSA